jgi:hypothetical protein
MVLDDAGWHTHQRTFPRIPTLSANCAAIQGEIDKVISDLESIKPF